MRDGPLLLAASGLRKSYPMGDRPVEVLKGVDLEVPAGRFVAIMGPSGSGKSTLLNLLSGLDLPSEGEVRFEGRPLGELSDAERTTLRRRRIGFIFQFFNLVPFLTVEENVALPFLLDGRPLGGCREAVDRTLAALGLGSRRAHRPSELSGGEMQLVSIGRAIAAEPPLILADEPTGSVSSAAGLRLMEHLRERTRAGQAVVLVTHNPRDAAFADEVHFLLDGRLREERVLRNGFHADDLHARLQELGL